MKTYRYIMNVKSAKYESLNRVCLLAINKKEAEKFCKDFKGLKIIERSRKKHDFIRFDNSNDLMSAKKEA